MKAVVENIRNYYKYSDTLDVAVDLYDSNNTTYIDSTSKQFNVNSVAAWSTTQTYVLNNEISAGDITAFIPDGAWVQENAGWSINITANDDSITIWNNDFGYGVNPSGDNTVSFNPLTKIFSIKIYASCYRRSAQYCYGGINIGLTFTQRTLTPGTESDYDYYEDVTNYKVFKQGNIYKAIGE